MASQRQIDANRRNAAKSTGPKTETGKAAARYNAVDHGFAGDHFLLSVEDRPAYQRLRDELLDEHQPTTPTEAFQLEQMLVAMWRLRRVRAAEAAHLDAEMMCFPKCGDPEIGPTDAAQRLGNVYSFAVREFNPLLNFARYEARFERSYYRALHELQRLKAQRPKPTPPPPTPTKTDEKPEIGFVQQKPVEPDTKVEAKRKAGSLARNRAPARLEV
jgi:hypothetical protein